MQSVRSGCRLLAALTTDVKIMKLDIKLLIGLFLSFFAATIVGTLSHEFAHYMAAKIQGYNARITYGATFVNFPDVNSPVVPKSHIAITLAGPFQTMLFGTI